MTTLRFQSQYPPKLPVTMGGNARMAGTLNTENHQSALTDSALDAAHRRRFYHHQHNVAKTQQNDRNAVAQQRKFLFQVVAPFSGLLAVVTYFVTKHFFSDEKPLQEMSTFLNARETLMKGLEAVIDHPATASETRSDFRNFRAGIISGDYPVYLRDYWDRMQDNIRNQSHTSPLDTEFNRFIQAYQHLSKAETLQPLVKIDLLRMHMFPGRTLYGLEKSIQSSPQEVASSFMQKYLTNPNLSERLLKVTESLGKASHLQALTAAIVVGFGLLGAMLARTERFTANHKVGIQH